MEKTGATDKFIDCIYKTSRMDFPKHVVNKAEQCLLDYLAAVYAGQSANKDLTNEFCEKKQGDCKVFGTSYKLDVYNAALINGFNAHALEMDDGHRFGMIHLGAPIISALLAVCESERIAYNQMIKGIIMGYEASAKLAMAMQPEHRKKGFHATGTCGTIGVSVACAVSSNYDKKQIRTAVNAAATSAAGLLEIQENSSQMKAYNVSQAAISGIGAFYMGRTGIRGPEDIMAGPRGLIPLLSNLNNIEKLFEENNSLAIEKIYFKPYASCRHCHAPVEAAIRIMEDNDVLWKEIKNINVYIYASAINGHNHTDVQGVESAKLSIPYCVAAACILREGGINAFSRKNICNRDILDLTNKVNIIENAEFSKKSNLVRMAEVEIITTSDNVFSHRIDYAKGEPENPLSQEDLANKFINVMKWRNEKEKGKKILDLLSINKKPDDYLKYF